MANITMKINPKKTYRVYVYGENNKWLGNSPDLSGCKTAEECVKRALAVAAPHNDSVRAVSIMDRQAMQASRYKITFDNSKNGFTLSE